MATQKSAATIVNDPAEIVPPLTTASMNSGTHGAKIWNATAIKNC